MLTYLGSNGLAPPACDHGNFNRIQLCGAFLLGVVAGATALYIFIKQDSVIF